MYTCGSELVVESVADLRDLGSVKRVIKTAIMSKQVELADFLSELITKACISILPHKSHFNVDNVRVLKILVSTESLVFVGDFADLLTGRSVVRTRPLPPNFPCLGLGNLTVSQPSCFLPVTWQLGTKRVLQLNDFDFFVFKAWWFVGSGNRICPIDIKHSGLSYTFHVEARCELLRAIRSRTIRKRMFGHTTRTLI
ncbi:hypothetical protein T265_06484 [Opisthorchis viverrini]|uniref:Uncharacterized protein n=1 Tax=Opisthorchis viverrini TaxID=6198 RepID=A0A074ZG08_OPIVI|nr:hypothetical protein T265_06484 [Opisthorchis viverrini]KER26201.1 hypothetical protein T265_06484 [Opisthorchis viverrini]